MFRCYSYTIIRERINLCLLKLQLKKEYFKNLTKVTVVNIIRIF